jgi:hypothetical protein
MNEIRLFGGAVETGKLTVDNGDCGYEVRILVTSGPGPTQVTTQLNLEVKDAEALHAMLGDAIDEANEAIEVMAEEAQATIAGKPAEVDDPALVGAGADMPF